MSDTTQTSRSSGSSRRRRSRGGRNRSRSRGGNSNNNQQQQSRGGSHSSKQARSEEYRPKGPRPPRNAPPAPPLSWWQKLLKAIGLYKEPAAPARAPKKAPAAKKSGSEPRPAKSNTRNARTDGPSEKPASKSSKRSRSGSSKPRGGDGSSVESSRVYVGNLSYDVSEQDLQELFKGIGGVRNVEIVYNRNTHRSKGYGFVEMLHKDEAVRAVEVLHDQPFMGRKMIVSGAKSKGQDDREDQDDRDETPQKAVELAPLPEEKSEAPAAEAEAKIETVVETTPESAPAAEAPAAEAKPETADDLVAKYGFDEEPKKDQDA